MIRLRKSVGALTGLYTYLGQYRGQRLAVAAGVIAWLVLVGGILPDIGKVTQGFAAYYAASYAVLHGGAADLNNDDAFARWVTRAGIAIHEDFAGNVPTSSLLMIPLTAVSPPLAQTIWLILNVGMLAAVAWLAGRLCAPHNSTARWWIAAVFALLPPVYETIRYGQVYLLLALLSVALLLALLKGQDSIAGIALAGMVLLKPYYGVLTLGLLVWSRRPRSILVSAATILLIVVGSLPLLAEAWPGFIPALVSINGVAWAGIPANQTINSLFRHLFVYSAGWNPEPLVEAPWVAEGLHYTLTAVLVIVTLWQAWRHRDAPLWLYFPALTLMPVLAPVAELHHYAMLLLPVAVAVTRLIDHRPGRLTASLIGAALILLVIPWPSLHDPTGWGGWHGLFAYPRLMGAILLWASLPLR